MARQCAAALLAFYAAQDVAASLVGKNAAARACTRTPPFPEVPAFALELNGISWPERCYDGPEDEHIFLIGDYGGITCGHRVDGHDPNGLLCGKGRGVPFVKPADNTHDHPEFGRYHVWGSDDKPQQRVAKQMRARALSSMPKFVINGGDNFYWGGLDTRCEHPMNEIHERTRVQFDVVFEKMYEGEGMDVPWFSTLGNHDFGGRHFRAAWDQQIAYTWAANTSKRWILPALYWHQKVRYPQKDFSIDIFMVDTNKHDAKPWTHDAGHNICGTFNSGDGGCSKAGGPENKYTCHKWFEKLWNNQSAWLEKKLNESTADWQIVVTHMPPDQFLGSYWKELTMKYGIDLFVGSHKHMQRVYMKDERFGTMNWVLAGGGGGITSELNPDKGRDGRRQYGFMDLKINKTQIDIVSINHLGDIVETGVVDTRPPQGAPTCLHYGCGTPFVYWHACRCDADCWKYGSCCKDFARQCPALASCAAYGCFSGFDRKKPCQCNDDCAAKDYCCSDYEDKCDTLEHKAAVLSCDSSCTDIRNKTSSCRSRADFQTRGQRKRLATAIESVNEECAGQCNCTETVMRTGQLSLAHETAEVVDEVDQVEAQIIFRKAALLDTKMQLLDELAIVEAKLAPGANNDREEPLDNERIWSDMMDWGERTSRQHL